ncbi:conserved hypothetical protein [Beutenbergia cavernae DSM 12333]|uniref:Secreted protein n=1 Tax=Beutenbergia cavernae (strain ATCC BAA-8 / DSM 12333 / CCUG 43141 / JCM 11478 / NBRC 16432 / NCIMB 13614 / HKI 0122) TaxID=471853 RepID=C5C5S6_BEUC1|nr:DUF948 domain-containing protein [Beutenbergia cavernae]ACQ80267.1 conserved hypothetical protein [Beutenbergia cavernae DSM 12333]
MSLGDIAGLVAALAFVALVAFMAVPLLKLGKVLDETRTTVARVTEQSIPIVDEAAETLRTANAQLAKVDTVTTSAAEIGTNVSALTTLVSATVASPLIKVASFSYAVRSVVGRRAARRGRRR